MEKTRAVEVPARGCDETVHNARDGDEKCRMGLPRLFSSVADSEAIVADRGYTPPGKAMVTPHLAHGHEKITESSMPQRLYEDICGMTCGASLTDPDP